MYGGQEYGCKYGKAPWALTHRYPFVSISTEQDFSHSSLFVSTHALYSAAHPSQLHCTSNSAVASFTTQLSEASIFFQCLW
uniref:Uncharacterized protein n=1 Tax=Pyxicephalus adspersus TaxID=30357 RepID=A0AAV2ZN20_PYXAD|nr:TPA: hypothetical protein GDO54_004645 [Pyxicephalus adspersus]DBA15433.1 TPA: hypothetical protein GDO54_004645 [Pyxicephalus adspersus]